VGEAIGIAIGIIIGRLEGKGNMSAIQLYREHPKTYEPESVGTITESQLDFLIENLEEDFEEDEEYFLSPEIVVYLKGHGADNGLITILEKALSGNRDGVEIFYSYE
jgi:hypothetical protein